MMLGSIYTLSYAKPRRWWHRFTKRYWQSQTASLVSQINKGVTCFDIRFVRDRRASSEQNPISFSAWSSAVGSVVLKARPLWAIYLISRRCPNAYVRVSLEKGTAGDALDFIAVCRWLQEQYPNIHFYGGYWLDKYQQVYFFPNVVKVSEIEYKEHI